MPKYIGYFPKPFLDDLVQGRCVPFIGAGFSKNAKLPPNTSMPTWDELGRQIAKDLPSYDYSGALDAISAYCHEYSRAKLVELLSNKLLVNSAQPGAAHTAFCRLPFELACTTNFEFLLESGYAAVGKYCRPVVSEDQLAINSTTPIVALLKIHGDLNHPDRLVITEDDYDAFIDHYPLLATFLANLLISKTALFLGYSLDDPDFRYIWRLVSNRLGRLRRLAYTIAVNPRADEVARFGRRGVRVIALPGALKDYSSIVEDAFQELDGYWSREVIRASSVTEEEPRAELSLPADTASRLCFFAVPSSVLSLYRANVFPIVDSYGLTPVAPQEVLATGDNLTAKIVALLDRSRAIVADVSSANASQELTMALSRGFDRQKVLAIAEEGTQLPIDVATIQVVIRPRPPYADLDEFLSKVGRWFAALADELRPSFQGEPQRLLIAKEYRAAVISALSLLEYELRSAQEHGYSDQPLQHAGLGELLRLAIRKEIINGRQAEEARDWLAWRNRLVHSPAPIDRRNADRIVAGVYELLNELRARSRPS